jgi:pyrroloquinoline quinone biosynthesis protein B
MNICSTLQKMGIVRPMLILLLLSSCTSPTTEEPTPFTVHPVQALVLGIAQDAGYPQADCQKACCRPAWDKPDKQRKVACIAIADAEVGKAWIIDATPDFPAQLQYIKDSLRLELGGILLTHAHIGHYTGLMYLGREAMGADGISVYAMPRMDTFLRQSGPWSQLVSLDNIRLQPIQNGRPFQLSANLRATPIRVPHRDEFSETVGFSVQGPDQKLLYIPDIDKWERWRIDIDSLVSAHDVALLDATFYSDDELPGRNISEIPHPFVEESLQRFGGLPDSIRQRIHFIHLNHTNPLLQEDSPQAAAVSKAGMRVSREGIRFAL